MKIFKSQKAKRITGIMSAIAAASVISLGSVAVTPAQTYAATATQTTGLISRATAKNTALKHAKATASKTSKYEIELEYKKGVAYYEVEFVYNNYEYEYLINAKTGKIAKYEKEAVKKKTTTQKKTTTKKLTAKISVANAKTIALKNAGLTASQINSYKSELDREDGVVIYEIEFKSGKYKYEYEINANTGKILDIEKKLIKK